MIDTTNAHQDAELAAIVAAAQAGDGRAVEDVLTALEGAVVYYAHQRAERTANGGMLKEDMQQEGRMAILEALRDYNPEAGVKFSTYAIMGIKGAISTEAFKETVPGVPPANAATYAAALKHCQGDHDAAEAFVQNVPDPRRRLSREMARRARFGFAPAVSLDSMESEDKDAALAAQSSFKFRGDRTKSPQDRWAERQGEAEASLALQRDDVAHDTATRSALVNNVLLPVLSPTQRGVIDHTYGTSGAAWLVKIDTKRIGMRGADVTPDLDAIAQAVGSNAKSVKVMKSQALAKMRRVFGDFEDALDAAAVLSA